MVWKSCGYLSLTKNGKRVAVVVKRMRYVASLDDVKAILEGKLGYTQIYEPMKIQFMSYYNGCVVLWCGVGGCGKERGYMRVGVGEGREENRRKKQEGFGFGG